MATYLKKKYASIYENWYIVIQKVYKFIEESGRKWIHNLRINSHLIMKIGRYQ